jgi:sulfur carrier protein ThiS
MHVFVDEKKIKLKEEAKVADALKSLKLNPEMYLITINNELVVEEEKLKNNQKLKLIKIISSG